MHIRTSHIALCLSLIFMGMVIYIVARNFDLQTITRLYASADPGWIVVALLPMAGLIAVSAARVQHILRSLRSTLVVQLISVVRMHLINQFMVYGAPVGGLVEVARIGLIKLRFNVTLGDATRTVLFERVLGMLGMVMTGVVASLAQWLMDVHGTIVLIQLAVWTLGTLVALLLILAPKLHLKIKWRPLFVIVNSTQMLGRLLRNPSFLFRQAILAVIMSFCFSAILWALAKAMSISISAPLIFVFAPVILMISSLPIFFLGWGGREAIMIATLGVVGRVPATEILALSIAYGAIVFVSSLPGGILWLMRPGLRKQIRHEAELLQKDSLNGA
jgi:uncharacterized membrane protein YbhN (UPF0104 family)